MRPGVKEALAAAAMICDYGEFLRVWCETIINILTQRGVVYYFSCL